VRYTNGSGRTGAEGGQEIRGAGETQQAKTAPTNITPKGLRGGDGPFPMKLKLLWCPPGWGWGPGVASLLAPGPVAKPTPGPQPHLLSHGSSSPAPAMNSRSAPPCRSQEVDPPAGAPCALPLVPWEAHASFRGVEVHAVGVGWLGGTSPTPLLRPSGCSSPRWRAERAHVGENGIRSHHVSLIIKRS